ncbi:MAG: Lactyl (2) diphospho-(5')guanosine:7,8-didemethyl-8-hydroxy-5-deazariboflavin 2-phospho-L-lactate transferase [uncultured Thermomicrobiales bacterium]|uniref:Lactyl (2) diphospho-(5')guanosine:7,8-didemethyl-8-hydroxy-5-deazarib oflavin 2-phospho-L-lactate transferase n=1 Tax=uncultured Thermomicrobiales bacterium TaxID=1645740 RepID=A0A6J4U6Y5_9BACT|nr:MAG: Lactyl (2) diphospho-(5')guanosine:7,8-didemethyl-8-hydroxy-5-deazariboflavin 2-phospho-L-lactate transferase [uncultured Thermomicrobiales bacterium]
MIVALAGGVGGAKLAQGLARARPPGDLTVVINTADDFDLYGLRICPDLDTVLYTLAGIADPTTGWGIAGDTHHAMDAIAGYGRDPWFRLGDRDLATHVLRTERLRDGSSLSTVTAEFAAALGVATALVPMSDERVATLVDTPAGRLEFQDYFVARRQQDVVTGVVFDGVEAARPAPAVAESLADATLIVFCPSNPIVSIGPILAVPGLRDLIAKCPAPKIAVSPIVGGRALKGPADRMLASLGFESSALGVAKMYAGLVDAIVIDDEDAALAPAIREGGMRVLVTQTVMGGPEDRERLAAEVIGFGLGRERGGGR